MPLFLNDGTGHYGAAPAAMLPPRAEWHNLVPLDFNRDGKLDVLDLAPENWDRPGQPTAHTIVRAFQGR